MFLYILMFLASVVVTLGACTLFTNAIEWLGRRFNLSQGAVGSVLAALGTTLPETSIPVIAIFFGSGQEQVEVGLGAILGAPFMLSTLVLPILAGLLVLYAKLGKRAASFKLNYREVQVDIVFFLVAYSLAVACAFISSPTMHTVAAITLLGWYGYYIKLKFASVDEEGEEGGGLEPLMFAKKSAQPSLVLIVAQAFVGLAGLAGGAHLFVTAAEAMSTVLRVSPLLLALLIAPLATELPEMSNSFLWLYRKKDTLAVGNVTGAMVFQSTCPVAVGLLGTTWSLGATPLLTMELALVAMGLSLAQLLGGGHWRPWMLGAGALLYGGFSLYLIYG
jgi:cation:H+ antiporter